MMGLAQIGTVFGPLLGGAFTEYSSWRWRFYVNLPIGAVVASLLVFIDIPEQTFHKLGLIGFVLFAPAAIQLLLALDYGAHVYGWKPPIPIGLFIGSGATFILFLLWERHQRDDAMMLLGIIGKRIFQAINDDSPMMSGVYLLPLILSQLLLAVVSGALVGKLGYYLPWAVFGQMIGFIGTGLMSTFDSHTSMSKWIGYQVVAGVGQGSGFQMPIIAIQNMLPQAEISLGMSVMMFCRTLSGAVVFAIFEVLFSSGLTTLIPKDAPGIAPQVVISAGVTGIQSAVSSKDLPGVLTAYAKSIDYVFYLSAAFGASGVAFACGMGWKDIRTEKVDPGPELTMVERATEEPVQEQVNTANVTEPSRR